MWCLFKKLITPVNVKIHRNLKTYSTIKEKSEDLRYFEHGKKCLPECWIIVSLDGTKLSKFSEDHEFSKPNDIRSLDLMNHAAASVMDEFPDIVLAHGKSDEYSFVFRKETRAYNRRVSSFAANVASRFSAAYVFNWPKVGLNPLKYPAYFGGSVFVIPSDKLVRDYLSWRQTNVHENNLYNTCFWNLVQKKNMTPEEAQKALKGTVSSDKHELLLHTFNINYNDELEIFRNGSTLIKKRLPGDSCNCESTVVTLTCDLVGDKFWEENPQILNPKAHKNETDGAKKNTSL